jgi:hypothetical protein
MNKTITIHIFHANIVIIRADTLTVLFKTYTLIMCIVVSLLYSNCAWICVSDVCLVSQLLYYSVLQCNKRQWGSPNCLCALQLTIHRCRSIQHSWSTAKLGIVASQSALLHLLTWIHSYICSLPKFFDSSPSLPVPPCTGHEQKKPIAHLLALPHVPHPVLPSTVYLTDFYCKDGGSMFFQSTHTCL